MKNFQMDPANARLSDVELANLRELPRRGNFVQTTNILYSSGSMTDSEIALLPRIRLDQVWRGKSKIIYTSHSSVVFL